LEHPLFREQGGSVHQDLRRTTDIVPFHGAFTTLGGDAPPSHASDILNVRTGDGKARPRYGYRNISPAPAGFDGAWGFERLSGYDDENENQQEWVGIEERNNVARPYAVDPETGFRTEITSGGTPVSLAQSPWRAFVFRGDSYWVNPETDPSVYVHEVGNDESWADPLGMEAPSDFAAGFDRNLTLTLTAATLTPSGAAATATVASVSGVRATHTASTTGAASILIDLSTTAGGNRDWQYRDHIALGFSRADNAFRVNVNTIYVNARNAAGTTFTPTSMLVEESEGVVRIYAYFDEKTRADWAAIRYIDIDYDVVASTASAADNWCEFYAITPGAIDFNYGDDSIPQYVKFAASCYDSELDIESPLAIAQIHRSNLDSARTVEASGLALIVSAVTTFSWTGVDPQTDAVRIYAEVEGTWLMVHEVTTTTYGSKVLGKNRAEVLTDNKEYSGGTFIDSTGIIAGTAFKGWAVWLYKGGFQNVRHSKVGKPLSQANDVPGADLEDDLTRGNTFSLADNFADEPLGAVQAGDALMILGREGVYTQAGDYPSQMTPPRKIPGSMGCANRFSFARFRSDVGEYGVAWLDTHGNVWFAGSSLAFASDAAAKPVELTSPIRGKLREFLIDESDLGFTDFSEARMDVDERTGALWIFQGDRAAKLTSVSPAAGTRQWELYQYALTSSDGGTEDECTGFDPPTGTTASSEARAGSTDAWTTPANAVESDDAYASIVVQSADKSEYLKFVGSLKPTPALPADATMETLTVRVEHYLNTDNVTATLDHVQLLHLGVAVGTATAGGTVPTEEGTEDITIDITGLDVTPAKVNAGEYGLRLGYTIA
jgi:hypothetical protein